MICPNCKRDNTENTRWCCYCGALFEKPGAGPSRLRASAVPVPKPQRARPAETPRPERHAAPDSEASRSANRRPVFPWFLVILSLLVIGFFICAVFVPSFSDKLMGLLPSGEKGAATAPTAPVDERRSNEPDPYTLPAGSSAGAPTANIGSTADGSANRNVGGQSDPNSWSDAYRAYVLDRDAVFDSVVSTVIGEKAYTMDGLQYFKSDYSEPRFSLYDLDRSGTPELIIFNGAASMAGGVDYVFTFEQGQVRPLGKIGFRACQLYAVDDPAYPGLFCTDGNNGLARTEYYTLQSGSIGTQELSRPSDAIRALPFSTVDEIRAMGWDEFVRSALNVRSEAASASVTQQPVGQSGTVIPIESGVQYAANIFLSNFSEQHAFERNGFDADRYDARELAAFAYLHCVINRRDALRVERIQLPSQDMEHAYFSFSLDTVNDILYRHFGITLRDDELRQQAWNEQFFYAEGNFYIIASSGEAYNRLTVVRQIEQLPDGNFRLLFDIYGEDIQLYRQENDAVNDSYYYLTSSAAEANPNFTRESSGTAIVRPYVHDGVPTMQLIRYSIG